MDYENSMKAYGQLADEESRQWFNARVQHAIKKDPVSWWEHIHKLEVDFHGADIGFLSAAAYEGKKFVIFGAGAYGKHAQFILTHSIHKNRLAAFVDNELSMGGGQVCGLPVLSPYDLMRHPDDYVVVIGSGVYGLDMYRQLCFMGFPQSNIYMPREGRLVGICGQQYFDVFDAHKDEVFVDAGCFDGRTSCDFVNWCHGNYHQIYAFEPTPEMAQVCRRTFAEAGMEERVRLHEKVCWSSSNQRVKFSVSSTRGASCVTGTQGDMETLSIDDMLAGSPVSFIKMDVEGSEMEVLRGAESSIRRYRPRMAISLYHKPEDIFELPAFVMELNRDYKLYIRHYTSDIWETVLYAV